MPEDPIYLRADEVTVGRHDRIFVTQYEAPGIERDNAGKIITLRDDPFKEWDLWAAGEIEKVMIAHVPIYPGWTVRVDGKQKFAAVSLQSLMGTDEWYFINLTTHDITPRMILHACGEILERYGLPRDRLDIAAFEAARKTHSRLVDKRRKVPN